MTGSWLAQMGWDVAVVDDALQGPLETGPWRARPAGVPAVTGVTADFLAGSLADGATRVVEMGPLAGYQAGHLPGSAWALRGDLALQAGALLGEAVGNLVLVSENPAAAGSGTGDIAGRLGSPDRSARGRQGGVAQSWPAL